jgi:hypothetical protein
MEIQKEAGCIIYNLQFVNFISISGQFEQLRTGTSSKVDVTLPLTLAKQF